MTIKGLSSYIKNKYPTNIINIPINNFSGKKIAIDSYGWIYSNYIQARKTVIYQTDLLNEEISQVHVNYLWIGLLIKFINSLLINNIIPVFVMDGTPPIEKLETKEKRSQARDKINNDIENIRQKINSRQKNDIFDKCEDLLPSLRLYMSRESNIPSENFSFFIDIIKNLGLPCIQSEGDGERLCSILNREGKVSAVYSKDIDNLAFGAPLMIKGPSKDSKLNNHFECIILEKVLNSLELNYEQFRDFCILIGCDYNKNIFRVGPAKGHILIKECKAVENLDKKYDYSCVKIDRCRELFKIVPSSELIIERYYPENYKEINCDILDVISPNKIFFENINLMNEFFYVINMIENLEYSNDQTVILENIKIFSGDVKDKPKKIVTKRKTNNKVITDIKPKLRNE